MIKPYFNPILARDVLSRDSVSHHLPSKDTHSHYQSNIDEMNYDSIVSNPGQNWSENLVQNSLYNLLKELVLMHCIFVTEHEMAKQGVLENHFISVNEIIEIISPEYSKT